MQSVESYIKKHTNILNNLKSDFASINNEYSKLLNEAQSLRKLFIDLCEKHDVLTNSIKKSLGALGKNYSFNKARINAYKKFVSPLKDLVTKLKDFMSIGDGYACYRQNYIIETDEDLKGFEERLSEINENLDSVVADDIKYKVKSILSDVSIGSLYPFSFWHLEESRCSDEIRKLETVLKENFHILKEELKNIDKEEQIFHDACKDAFNTHEYHLMRNILMKQSVHIHEFLRAYSNEETDNELKKLQNEINGDL